MYFSSFSTIQGFKLWKTTWAIFLEKCKTYYDGKSTNNCLSNKGAREARPFLAGAFVCTFSICFAIFQKMAQVVFHTSRPCCATSRHQQQEEAQGVNMNQGTRLPRGPRRLCGIFRSSDRTEHLHLVICSSRPICRQKRSKRPPLTTGRTLPEH